MGVRLRCSVLGVGVVVLTLAGVGCRSGSSGGGTQTSTSARSTPSSNVTAITGSATTPVGNVNGGNAELNTLAQQFASGTFQAQYQMMSTSDSNGAMTIYKQGVGKIRFDVTSSAGGNNVALTAIESPSGSVFCLQDAGALAPILGTAPGEGVCFNGDPTNGGASVTNLTGVFKNFSTSSASVTGTSSRTIAGAEAKCFDYDSTGASATDETCFSNTGVLLYDKTTTAGDTTTIEAIRVQGSVPDSVFDAPYQIKSLPGSADTTNVP